MYNNKNFKICISRTFHEGVNSRFKISSNDPRDYIQEQLKVIAEKPPWILHGLRYTDIRPQDIQKPPRTRGSA